MENIVVFIQINRDEFNPEYLGAKLYASLNFKAYFMKNSNGYQTKYIQQCRNLKSQRTCSFRLHRIPYIAVKIIITGQQQPA